MAYFPDAAPSGASPAFSIFNRAAERAVIAALIRKPDPALILQLGIEADLFQQTETREAFIAIIGFMADGTLPDAATLENALSPRAMIEVETSLSENASAAHLPVYVQLLKRCRLERQRQDCRQWLAQAVAAGRPAAEIRALTDQLDALERPEKRPRTFTNLSTLLDTPPAENWLVRGFIAADSTNVIFGDSGTGKSFVTIDLLCHIAAGMPWCGSRVKQGNVLYIAGEGQNGIIRRFKAWFEAHPGHDEAIANIEVRTIPAALCDPEATALLVQEIAEMADKPRVIAIDTLARNFGGGDENATKDMNQFVAGLDALRMATGAAIVVPHHSGHGDKNRGRGSSVLRAAVDGEFQVERCGTGGTNDIITLRCSKMKDSEPPGARSWELTQQLLPWCDEEGTPMNSAVLVPVDHEAEEQSGTFHQKQRLSPAQRIAMDALRSALIQNGIETEGVVTVTEDQWRQAAYSAGISSSDQPRALRLAFQRARQELVAAKQVSTEDGRYWLPAIRGTKRNKEEHCSPMFPGISVGGEEQRGTHSFRSVPLCSSPADTPTPEQTETGRKKINDLSPLAKTIIATLHGTPMLREDLERIADHAHPKAGALVSATIDRLLLAGAIGKENGRLVTGGSF